MQNESRRRYRHTRWRTIPATKMKVEMLNAPLSWKIDYGKKNDYLTPSYDAVSEHIRKNVKIDYYLMDEADRRNVRFMADTFREQWEARCYDSMGTMENFAKTVREVMGDGNRKEKFYLRTLPPLFSDGHQRVLAEDVACLLLALKAGRIIDAEDPAFYNIINNSIIVQNHGYGTYSLDYISKLFEAIDFDKSVVTLVDDPVVLSGRAIIHQKGGHFTIRSSRMKRIISIPQGTLCLVHSLVCGVNWKKVPREDKDKIAASIRKVSCIDKLNYVEYSFVISIIIEEKKRFSELYSTKTADFTFADSEPQDQVPLEYYLQVTKDYELMPFANVYPQFGVYMVRVLFVLGWIVNFNEERGYLKLAETVLDELMNYITVPDQPRCREQFAKFIRECSNTKFSNAEKTQNGNGSTITNGESGIVNIAIGDDPTPEDAQSCVHCERIQNQYYDVQNQLDSFHERHTHCIQEKENYNVLIDQIHEQKEEIEKLKTKLDALENAKPVIQSRGYATECRKLEAENQKLTDKIKFFDNTSSESQRGINTIIKQNEQTQAMNANLEKQIMELEKQSSHISEFSAKMIGLTTKDQDRVIAELEESIKDLQIEANRQEEIIKDLDKKAEPKIS